MSDKDRAQLWSLAAVLAAMAIGIAIALRHGFPATAICILVSSLGLATNVIGQGRDWRLMQWLSAAFALWFTTGSLTENLIRASGFSWLRDIFPVPLLLVLSHDPGIMSLNVTACFYLLSAVVLLLPTRHVMSAKAFAAFGLACVGFVLLRHLLQEGETRAGDGSLPASFYTALSLALLFFSALLARPEIGPLRRSMTGDTARAYTARLLLPIIVIGPIVTVWMFLEVSRLGFYGAELQLALTTISTVLLLASAAIFAAARIDALQGAKDTVARELTLSRSRLEAVVRNMPVGVAVTDAPSGQVVLSNARMDIIRRSLAPVSLGGLELTTAQRAPGGTDIADWPIAQAVADGGVISDIEVPVLRSDGTPGWLSLSAAPVHDQTGAVTSTVVALLDITERRTAEEERIDLLKRIVQAQEQERLRIARELHDQMGQDLVALSLGLKSLEPLLACDHAGPILAGLRATVERMSMDVHRTAFELRPTSLSDLGLKRALATLVQTWADRLSLQADTHLDDLDDYAHLLSEETEIAMYRSVQEALTNIAKHASARHIGVLAKRLGNMLRIVVEDDGRGFDSGAASSSGGTHLGLKGIRERLLLVGGEFLAESSPGKGTTLIMSIPLLPQISRPRAA